MNTALKLFPVLALLLQGCAGGNGEIDPALTNGSSAASESTVTITAISATPAVLLPGQSTILSVTATSTDGSSLQYLWRSSDGMLGSNSLSTTNWTAPNATGTYHITVDITDGAGSQRGLLSVSVSATPPTLQVSNVLPAEARTGESVVVHGSGFGSTQGTGTVTINGTLVVSIQSWSDSEITMLVPTNATTGDVVVHAGGSDSNPGRLTVLWTNHNPDNVSVNNRTGNQNNPVITGDGQGGAIIAWVDYRNGSADIYAQRLDSRGRALWTSGGRVVCSAIDTQLSPRIVSDDAGGAIVVWQDLRDGTNNNIYAQRIDGDGNPLWIANGVAVAGMSSEQIEPRLTGDGANGAIIVWQDYRTGSHYDIYGQKLNDSGVVQWAAGGVPLVTLTGNQINPQVASDAASGAIVVWEDNRSGTNFDIYAQRLDSAGAVQWALDGVSVSSAVENQSAPHPIADGAGGVVVVWQDYRSGSHYDIYAQALSGAGAVGWTVNGMLVSNAANNQISPQIAQAETDRFVIAWEDYRNGHGDVYAQQINQLGAAQWTSNGVVVTNIPGDQKSPSLVADAMQSVIVAWEDHRLVDNRAIFAQRLASDGSGLWQTYGVAISSAQGDQLSPAITADSAGGAIIAWEDYRNGNADIYAQGISAGGLQ